jgi:regulator of sirC expression with transglutaminase-like and TPR domain
MGGAGESPRKRFAALVSAPDEAIDLTEAALCIAAEEYPELDVAAYRERLAELARAAASSLEGASGLDERVAALNRFLFVEEGFAGNRADYFDPRNSFLNDVIDRRVGIPITLALIYMEVGRALGFDVRGISFPGHFLVKCVGEGREIVVDPYYGSLLDAEACERRLTATFGVPMRLDPPQHLAAASAREILVRMLGNLKHVFAGRSDFQRALACCERILLLVPDAPLEVRDRGLLYEQLDRYAAALADLERFLELAPGHSTAERVRERCAALRSRARMH